MRRAGCRCAVCDASVSATVARSARRRLQSRWPAVRARRRVLESEQALRIGSGRALTSPANPRLRTARAASRARDLCQHPTDHAAPEHIVGRDRLKRRAEL